MRSFILQEYLKDIIRILIGIVGSVFIAIIVISVWAVASAALHTYILVAK